MERCKRHCTTKQRKSYDCGITCAMNILRYYGKDVSRKDFMDLLNNKIIRRNGASMYDLIEVLKYHNIKARGVMCDLEILVNDKMYPAILKVEMLPRCPHYIVVYDVGNGNITVADPSMWMPRVSKLPLEKFVRRYRWNGEMILLSH